MFQDFFWTWIPWIFNRASVAVDTGRTVFRVVYNELTLKREWIFLKNSNTPISTQTFGPMEDAHVKWRCSINPCIFVEPGFQFEEERHLSYLGFLLKIPSDTGTKEIDISNWVNELKWKGALTTNNEPTLKEIFILWCFTSGEQYFYCLDEIQVEYINDMGDIIKKGLNE